MQLHALTGTDNGETFVSVLLGRFCNRSAESISNDPE